MERDVAEALASGISLMSACMITINEDDLAEAIETFKAEEAEYKAIGILDGNPTYFRKLADLRARIRRAEAILNLKRVSRETQEDIFEKA